MIYYTQKYKFALRSFRCWYNLYQCSTHKHLCRSKRVNLKCHNSLSSTPLLLLLTFMTNWKSAKMFFFFTFGEISLAMNKWNCLMQGAIYLVQIKRSKKRLMIKHTSICRRSFLHRIHFHLQLNDLFFEFKLWTCHKHQKHFTRTVFYQYNK